ncbi:MAG: FemAB family PEP-CTERM system-associated protein [Candidatus Lernaella stagnicola]|nr:FemAB family PEP-CTERM system-associated protein [Candidatus Lernaella stagnicola]
MRLYELTDANRHRWDAWLGGQPTSTVFHCTAWRDIIAETLRHQPVYLVAQAGEEIQGVLPLFILRTRLFGNMAVSMPFLNYGGVVAAQEEAAEALMRRAREVAERYGCNYVEYRHRHLPPGTEDLPTNTFKVTSILDLSGGVERVWKEALHQNVRNKVRKAAKNDVVVRRGVEHLDAFYRVFAVGQRNHGTPVLPRRFFAKIVEQFGDAAHVYAAYHGAEAIGGKLTIDFGSTRYFIWSASRREANRMAPVPAMNWRAIQDAVDIGLQTVDFGRSTQGTSSEKFKKHWGVETQQLYWQYQLIHTEQMPGLNTSNPKFELAIRAWKKLPVWLTTLIGPPLARLLP